MTKKHDYALYNVARVDGEWKKLDHFPVTISFDYYESDEEAMDDLRKKALYNLFREFSERSPFLPLDLDSRTYMICDETAGKILSVFTLEARLKEERI